MTRENFARCGAGGGVTCLQTGFGRKSLYVVDFKRDDVAGIPHPGCFAQRVWICLIAKELRFGATTKSLQEYMDKGFSVSAVGENRLGCG
jgi:hypothetical protein